MNDDSKTSPPEKVIFPEKPEQNTCEQWLNVPTGDFHYLDICDGHYRNIKNGSATYLRKIVSRMVEKKLVEAVGSRDGIYRVVEDTAKPVDWRNYKQGGDSGVVLPFGLQKYCVLPTDSLMTVGGSKSSGKTGFLLRTCGLNIHGERDVVLLSNLEGGIGMLRDRLFVMDIDIPEDAKFSVLNVYENYHDYIKKPNTLYVIDYIDVPDGEGFYKIGYLIKKIAIKLIGLNSVAVVGLQKPSTRDIPLGGEQTIKSSMISLAIDKNKLKIIDCKVSAKPHENPNNMAWTFDYDNSGTNFTNIKQKYGNE